MPDPAPKPPYNMALGSSSTVTSERDHEHGLQHRRPPASGIRATIARAALHTSPAFFSVTMGTGISSILLYNFPYPARWLEYLGIIAFVLNVVIFTVLLALTMARFILFRGLWTQLLHHNVASMFWGTFPMGFVTIIVSVAGCREWWGKAADSRT